MNQADGGQASPACGVCLAAHKPLLTLAGRPTPLRVNGRTVEQVCRDCARELELETR